MTSLLRAIIASCLLALGCGVTGSTLIGATLTTGVGIGASVHNYNQGGCYSVCTAGSKCNMATGMCERIPCGGECPNGQTCQDGPTGPECITQIPIPASSQE
jgi:hypothetical protein